MMGRVHGGQTQPPWCSSWETVIVMMRAQWLVSRMMKSKYNLNLHPEPRSACLYLLGRQHPPHARDSESHPVEPPLACSNIAVYDLCPLLDPLFTAASLSVPQTIRLTSVTSHFILRL
jgi:hypothetical protein